MGSQGSKAAKAEGSDPPGGHAAVTEPSKANGQVGSGGGPVGAGGQRRQRWGGGREERRKKGRMERRGGGGCELGGH